MRFSRKYSQAGFLLVEEPLVKAIRAVILVSLLRSLSAFASDSYMIIRVNDPQSREVAIKTGVIEVANPDLRPDEVLVFATDKQIEGFEQ